jgi:hypothetical protein
LRRTTPGPGTKFQRKTLRRFCTSSRLDDIDHANEVGASISTPLGRRFAYSLRSAPLIRPIDAKPGSSGCAQPGFA